MASRFAPESWDDMDNSGRIAFCHSMAQTALRLAKTSSFSVAEALLNLAESWSRLATEITRTSLEPPRHVPEPLAGV